MLEIAGRPYVSGGALGPGRVRTRRRGTVASPELVGDRVRHLPALVVRSPKRRVRTRVCGHWPDRGRSIRVWHRCHPRRRTCETRRLRDPSRHSPVFRNTVSHLSGAKKDLTESEAAASGSCPGSDVGAPRNGAAAGRRVTVRTGEQHGHDEGNRHSADSHGGASPESRVDVVEDGKVASRVAGTATAVLLGRSRPAPTRDEIVSGRNYSVRLVR